MGWKVEITPEANVALKKLGTAEAQRVLKFLFNRIHGRENPREIGENLKGNLREYWRYRVGDYRILCRLEDENITVFVIQIGNRREIYKNK
ncbi:MAG: type II toxin-antitoxin system RelE/ParE family toxin [Lactobacillus sp.]|nr:type II toxin-antitoxin system RelE/ParE family toxin [Lactobacillus sp.]